MFHWLVGIILLSCSSNSEDQQAAEASTPEPAPKESTSVRPVHWSYEASEGPAVWGELSPVYALCGSGKSQSPINIEHSEVEGEAPFKIDYGTSSLKIAFNQHVENIVDNGHTIQINVDPGSTFTVGDKDYELKQFHFHTPSEHTVDGQHFPLEVHFVHQSDDKSLAVLGVLVQEGDEDPNFTGIINNLPQTKGESKHLENETLQLHLHVPQDHGAYYYSGSLTTPPCSEDVAWLVMRAHPTMSAEQVEAVASVISPNNRPVQQLNSREIQAKSLSDGSAN
ncbi:MAG: carbonic anhydrase [Cyclobacteriaceae bacterium]|nr:MAG: carbonic anhydrase [Cyclobacteriaceae bacterium]